jgi:hypothetical protein
MQQTKKTNANRFMPGLFDMTKDLCELMAPNSTALVFYRMFINNFSQGPLQRLEQSFHECPWNVSVQR